MKKILIALVSVCCLSLNIFNVSAADNGDTGIAPNALSYPCPNCNGTVVRSKVSSNALIDVVTVSCTHGTSGEDVYNVYGPIYKDRCGTCNYTEVNPVESYRVLYSCNGIKQ